MNTNERKHTSDLLSPWITELGSGSTLETSNSLRVRYLQAFVFLQREINQIGMMESALSSNVILIPTPPIFEHRRHDQEKRNLGGKDII